MFDFAPTDEQQALIDLVHTFVRKEVDPIEMELDPDAAELPVEFEERLFKRAEETGLRHMDVPEEYGGAGLDTVTQTLLSMEISQHRAGIYAPCFHAFSGFGLGHLYDGTEEQKQRFLYPMLAGEKKAYFALSEPSGGSDPARSIQTRAVRKGDGWVINGTKLWIGLADRADFGLVFARTAEGRHGITCFIVETDRPGFQVARVVQTLRSAKPVTELHLDNVEVPDENRVGEIGGGFALANDRLSRQRMPYAALSLGPAIRAQEMTIEWAKIREVFGKRLAAHQGIQWMLVENEIEIRSARLFLLEAASRADRGLPFRTESSIAKMVATEAASKVVDRCIQIHGGLGVSKDLPLERWYRELRIRRIAEGSTETHKMVVARELLGSAARD
jgi:alkylation response protein AidB-like acyl-CoA dehydrogenase